MVKGVSEKLTNFIVGVKKQNKNSDNLEPKEGGS
jgi:hypothetical protein